MTRTESLLGQVALAASLGIAAASAHAVPIVFDFTGTVTSGAATIGEAVTGRIVVETDGLARNSRTMTTGTSVTFRDNPTDAVDLVSSDLIIGGNVYDVGGYVGDQGYLTAFDTSGLPSCEGCASSPDYALVEDWSMSYWPLDGSGPTPPPGQYFGRRLALTWWPGPLDFIDMSNGSEPLDLASMLSAFLPTGFYREETYDCADLRCSGTGWSQTNFSIDTLTIQAQSVPEPGTLALFGIGLLGGAVARRSVAKGR